MNMASKPAVTIVVDDGHHCSAADALVTTLAAETELVTVSEFLKRAGTRYCDRSAFLVSDAALLDNFRRAQGDRLVINRVVDVSAATVAALDRGDGLISQMLVMSEYCRILGLLANVRGLPGLYSPAGNKLPLNLQWKLMNDAVPALATPKFFYGFGAVEAPVDDYRDPLWKSNFELYDWRRSEALQVQLHPFVVDKPRGEPVVAYFVGDRSATFRATDFGSLSPALHDRLVTTLDAVRKTFAAEMGEVLFYASEEGPVFAAFSHYLKTAGLHPKFGEVLKSGTESWLAAKRYDN
jgi:hypothetical protein